MQVYDFLTAQRMSARPPRSRVIMSPWCWSGCSASTVAASCAERAEGYDRRRRRPPPAAEPTPDRRPPRRLAGDRHSGVVFGILRWVVIAGFLVRHRAAVLLHDRAVAAADRGRAATRRRSGSPPSEFTLRPTSTVLSSTDNGGQGFASFLRNSGFVALASVAVTLLIGIPGAYAMRRLRFRAPQAERAVPGRLPVPADPAGDPAVRRCSPGSGCAASLLGLVLVYTAQTVPVAIYMLRNYFETVPESHRGGRAGGRADPARRAAPDQPAAGHARRSCRPGCSSS